MILITDPAKGKLTCNSLVNNMLKIKQIVPQEICLICDGCCRFIEKESLWRPVFTPEEKSRINNNLSLDKDHKINVIHYKKTNICPCFSVEQNLCKVYNLRPFDCQLYPFLLIRSGSKVCLGLDQKCPFTKTFLSDKGRDKYIRYLEKELTSENTKDWLRNNPSLFGVADSDVLELAFLFDLV